MNKLFKGLFSLVLLGSLFTATVNNSSNTIEANATSAADSYYRNVDTNKKGEAFVDSLSTLINTGARIGTYKEAYNRLCDTDEDPNNKGNIICFYTGVSYKKGTSGDNRQWNREHVWAKSHGFPHEKFKAYSDIHHLRATENNINSKRGHLDFDEVENHNGSVQHDNYGNKWINDVCFEPRDEVKGDVARMMFYMMTKYHNGALELKLVNKLPTRALTNNDPGGYGEFGMLNTLLSWHVMDPVDGTEIRRNEVIYGYQNNRNPYIDHPEYVNNAFNVNLDIPTPGEPDVDPNRPEFNQYNINATIDLINLIPNNFTLEDRNYVDNAKAMYDILNSEEQKYVTNYDKLEKALERLEYLLNGGDPTPKPEVKPGDVVVKDDLVITLDKAFDPFSYTPRKRLNIGEYQLEATFCGVTNGEFRIGSNNDNAQFGAEFGKDSNNAGAALKTAFTVENFSGLSFNIINTYGKPNTYKLYYMAPGATEFTYLTKGNITAKQQAVEIKLDKPVTGRIAIAFTGSSKPRVAIDKLDIKVSKANINPVDEFLKTQSQSSLLVEYNESTLDIVDADIRFGGRIHKDAFIEGAEYGVLVYDTNSTIAFGKQTKNDIEDLKALSIAQAITPVRVNASGKNDPNGEFYQLGWVITNMEGHYDYIFNAAIYMVYNNELYFAKPTNTSLSATANKYITDGTIKDETVLAILKKLI